MSSETTVRFVWKSNLCENMKYAWALRFVRAIINQRKNYLLVVLDPTSI